MQNRPQRDSILTNPSVAVPALPPGTIQETLAIIMGGGAGTRLFPLTKDRAKPAVPLGGKYRIVDIPISNCLNSELRSIYVLTQFNSMSLHRHIQASYKFDNFSRCSTNARRLAVVPGNCRRGPAKHALLPGAAV